MKILLTTALLLSLAFNVIASEDTLVRPSATAHLTVKENETRNYYAELEGQIRLDGVFVAEWIKEADEEDQPFKLRIRLIPNHFELKNLPYFSGYPIRILAIQNETEALKLAIEPNTLAQLKRKKLKQVKAIGTFWLENYNVTVECDNPWATATIVKASISKPLVLKKFPKKYGCSS